MDVLQPLNVRHLGFSIDPYPIRKGTHVVILPGGDVLRHVSRMYGV